MSKQMSTEFTKRELISKQALGAGLGVGALALLEQTQSVLAQTAFTTYAFPATGAPTARTMPDRLAEIKNVRDFGAVGNGTNDDTGAIQAAINAAIAQGGGTVFVPAVAYPNYYLITAPLTFTTSLTNPVTRLVTLRGEKGVDIHGSNIWGNFAGYLIDNPDTGGATNLGAIIGLNLKNPNAQGGCIRLGGQVTGEIAECGISAGLVGLFLATNSYNIFVRNCNIVGNNQIGTGLFATQSTIQNCSLTGWNVALQAWNCGLQVLGNRFEVNNTGMVLGMDNTGAANQISGVFISGNSTERNNIGINIVSAAGCTIVGNTITGTVNPTGGSIQYGLIAKNLSGSVIAGNTVSTYASVAGIDVSSCSASDVAFVGNLVNIGSGTGVAWNMPAAAYKWAFSFTSCNNPSAAFPFSSLPGQPGTGTAPVEGMQYDITDSITGTWGTIAAGGGSNHVRLRYNGINWTVVGS
jgi:hypothetical protein